MFDIGWGEFIVIGVVALIAIGPKELPGVLRAVGQWVGKIRRMASEFQGQFQEAMREAEMADLQKQVPDLSSVTDFTKYDPLAETQKEIESALETKPDTASPDAAAAPAEAAAAEAPLDISIPLPEPEPGRAEDFMPAETPPEKQAGGKA
jgi:sec-independent protein translocase protein TatB